MIITVNLKLFKLIIVIIMSSSLSLLIRNKLRVHFNRLNFINFIITINKINKIIIKRLKKCYFKIKDFVIKLKFKKSVTLSVYYVKQLFHYLNKRFIIY